MFDSNCITLPTKRAWEKLNALSKHHRPTGVKNEF